jgi:hypothetical protein
MTVLLTKINRESDFTSYTFDITADSFYPSPTSEYTDSPSDVYSITVHLELEPGRDFDNDITCESDCDIASAPYFWFHDYFGFHACLSHVSESAQTEILAQINATL